MESVGREDVISGTNYGDPNAVLRSGRVVFRSVVHDRLAQERGQRSDHRDRSDQLPLPDLEQRLRAAVRRHGEEASRNERRGHCGYGRAVHRGRRDGFLQDVEIWKNKAPIDNPLLSEEDGPVYQLRRWYNQFYTDVEDVTEDMTKRFEFEIDTTRAVASWKQEVAENVAAREAQAPQTTS